MFPDEYEQEGLASMPILGTYGVSKIQKFNKGGELVDMGMSRMQFKCNYHEISIDWPMPGFENNYKVMGIFPATNSIPLNDFLIITNKKAIFKLFANGPNLIFLDKQHFSFGYLISLNRERDPEIMHIIKTILGNPPNPPEILSNEILKVLENTLVNEPNITLYDEEDLGVWSEYTGLRSANVVYDLTHQYIYYLRSLMGPNFPQYKVNSNEVALIILTLTTKPINAFYEKICNKEFTELAEVQVKKQFFELCEINAKLRHFYMDIQTKSMWLNHEEKLREIESMLGDS